MMNEYGYGGSWMGHGLVGGFLMILFWAAVIYFIVWLVRRNTCRNNDKKPLDYLKERYAKGKVTKEQFEAMQKDITN